MHYGLLLSLKSVVLKCIYICMQETGSADEIFGFFNCECTETSNHISSYIFHCFHVTTFKKIRTHNFQDAKTLSQIVMHTHIILTNAVFNHVNRAPYCGTPDDSSMTSVLDFAGFRKVGYRLSQSSFQKILICVKRQ